MTCQQKDCTEEAAYTCYWPNQVTKQCIYHAHKLVALGQFMGITVPIVVLKDDE